KAGTYCFGVYVSDANFPNSTTTGKPCVTIHAALALDAGGSTLPLGEVGRPYGGTVCCASGGSTPYVWGVPGLPAGLTRDTAPGGLAGPPAASFGGILVPMGTDAAGAGALGAATLRIVPAPAITTGVLPSGQLGTAYTPAIGVSGGDGANHFLLVGDVPP